jgi:hypothetical protein
MKTRCFGFLDREILLAGDVLFNNMHVPLAEAADALRYLVEGRSFGRVVLKI